MLQLLKRNIEWVTKKPAVTPLDNALLDALAYRPVQWGLVAKRPGLDPRLAWIFIIR